jgi:hypothetical protein
MYPRVIEDYRECGVDIGKIVRTMIRHAPSGCLDGLDEVEILDSSPEGRGFARYLKEQRRIQLFVRELIAWQPWLLRKSVVFPYLAIGLALGHEIDHHLNRDNEEVEKEQYAEANALNYIYPFFFVTKPIRKVATFLRKKGQTGSGLFC